MNEDPDIERRRRPMEAVRGGLVAFVIESAVVVAAVIVALLAAAVALAAL